jgi:hypothetical protein
MIFTNRQWVRESWPTYMKELFSPAVSTTFFSPTSIFFPFHPPTLQIPSTHNPDTFHKSLIMSDMSAKVEETPKGFHVEGYEKIEYDFTFTENIFDKSNDGLANEFLRLNRCLAVMDTNIFNVYGQQLKDYFDHYNIELKVHKTMIGEKAKSMETLLSIVDSMTEFG